MISWPELVFPPINLYTAPRLKAISASARVLHKRPRQERGASYEAFLQEYERIKFKR